MSKKTDPEAALERARQRSLVDALAQERLALAAITKVMLLEVEDPQRVLARLDAMCRASEGNRKVPPGTRRAMIDGRRLVARAIERERATAAPTQATLLDPPSPEPNGARVDELAAASDGPQQLGLVGHGDQIGGDVDQAHEERVSTLAAIHAGVVEALKVNGASTDAELHHRYALAAMAGHLPQQTKTAIIERRRELAAAGRLRSAGPNGRGEPTWDLIERVAS